MCDNKKTVERHLEKTKKRRSCQTKKSEREKKVLESKKQLENVQKGSTKKTVAGCLMASKQPQNPETDSDGSNVECGALYGPDEKLWIPV